MRSLNGRNRPSQQTTWILFLAICNRRRLISIPMTCPSSSAQIWPDPQPKSKIILSTCLPGKSRAPNQGVVYHMLPAIHDIMHYRHVSPFPHDPHVRGAWARLPLTESRSIRIRGRLPAIDPRIGHHHVSMLKLCGVGLSDWVKTRVA